MTGTTLKCIWRPAALRRRVVLLPRRQLLYLSVTLLVLVLQNLGSQCPTTTGLLLPTVEAVKGVRLRPPPAVARRMLRTAADDDVPAAREPHPRKQGFFRTRSLQKDEVDKRDDEDAEGERDVESGVVKQEPPADLPDPPPPAPPVAEDSTTNAPTVAPTNEPEEETTTTTTPTVSPAVAPVADTESPTEVPATTTESPIEKMQDGKTEEDEDENTTTNTEDDGGVVSGAVQDRDGGTTSATEEQEAAALVNNPLEESVVVTIVVVAVVVSIVASLAFLVVRQRRVAKLGPSFTDSEINYNEYDWEDLPAAVRRAALTLGYNERMWDKEEEPALANKSWRRLTDEEQKAAKVLGYTKEKWDAE